MHLRFGNCVFDRASRTLTRDDRPMEITPKAFELLSTLLANRPRVLSKTELYERLWPKTFISDTSLARLVSELRKAIGDDAKDPRFVRTAHGHGYSFCGEAVDLSAGPRPRPRAEGVAGVKTTEIDVTAPHTGPKFSSVAVLLFRDLGGSAENAHLGLGLTDSIITELASVGSLVVRPTAAVLHYQDRQMQPQEVGRELAVDVVVDGCFQRAGSRLRVTVQLIGTEGRSPIWAAKLDTSVEDLFEMQDMVSREVVKALEVELPGKPLRRDRRTVQPLGKSYEHYYEGKLYLYRSTGPDTYAAIGWFEKSREADPSFALAWAGLAEAYSRLAFSLEPKGDWQGRAKAACDRALALDPTLAEGRYVRARLLWSPHAGFDHAGALGELAAALAVRPNLTEALDELGNVLLHVGMLDEALDWSRRALAIDPKNMVALTHMGLCRYLRGGYPEAIEITEEVARRSPSAWVHYQAALCHVQLGDLEAASHQVELGRRRFRDVVFFHSVPALIAAQSGKRKKALAEISHTSGFDTFGHYHHAQHDVACAYAALGMPDEALDWLGQAAANGFPCHTALVGDPLLAPLRQDPRFDQLMRRLEAECDGYHELYRELFNG